MNCVEAGVIVQVHGSRSTRNQGFEAREYFSIQGTSFVYQLLSLCAPLITYPV